MVVNFIDLKKDPKDLNKESQPLTATQKQRNYLKASASLKALTLYDRKEKLTALSELSKLQPIDLLDLIEMDLKKSVPETKIQESNEEIKSHEIKDLVMLIESDWMEFSKSVPALE